MVYACNAQFTDVKFEAALCFFDIFFISSVENEQKLCLKTVAQKRDFFQILPTGFGKSLINSSIIAAALDFQKSHSCCFSTRRTKDFSHFKLLYIMIPLFPKN